MSNKTSRITFLVVLLLITAGVAIGQTVHWRIKLNTGQVGRIIAGPNDTDPTLVTFEQSTANVGIGVNPSARLTVYAGSGQWANIIGSNAVGFGLYNIDSGTEVGTTLGPYTLHSLRFMTNNIPSMILTPPDGTLLPAMAGGRLGVGVNPTTGINVNARLLVCRTGSLGSQCIIPANSPTVMVLGSDNDAATGSSLRAKGSLLSEGDVNVITSGKGFVVKESNGSNCRRITVNNTGAISVSAGFACP